MDKTIERQNQVIKKIKPGTFLGFSLLGNNLFGRDKFSGGLLEFGGGGCKGGGLNCCPGGGTGRPPPGSRVRNGR